MEDRLRNLKKTMKSTVFTDLEFTSEHKETIKGRIRKLTIKSEEDLLLAILQILSRERNGFEIQQAIRARGIQNFDSSEGSLYTLLHRLEHKGYADAVWKGDEAKYYRLADKGKRLLSAAERKQTNARLLFKELMGVQ